MGAILLTKGKYIKTAATLTISTFLLFSSTTMAASSILKTGSRGSEVSQLQQDLKDLGFYDYSKITGYYGSVTKDAVVSFQKSKRLHADGIAGPATFSALAKITHTLKRGSRGSEVKELQQLLKSRGFYTYSTDGIFGLLTEKAVKTFQANAGITADGIVGSKTLSKLYATSGSTTSTDSKREESMADRGTGVEMLSWSQVDKMFPRKTTARVTDVDTGKSFNIYRLGGYLHADVEPLTAQDTAIMKQAYGGKWSWNRRAVIVEINGKRIAGSMNGMPHGQQDIYGNNFDGQFCIHFLGSKVHKSGKVDANHQAMVKKAANAR